MWRTISEIINSSKEKTLSRFKSTLQENKLLPESKELQNQIMPFVKEYFIICSMIYEYIQSLSSLYKAEFSKSLGSDDLLPLLINLLPTDEMVLKALVNQCQNLQKITDSSATGFCLATFYISLLQRQSEMSENKKVDVNIERTLVLLAERQKINDLLKSCKDYKTKISNELITHLKKFERSFYQTARKEITENGPMQEGDIVKKIFQKIDMDGINFKHHTTDLLRCNYFIASDLVISLKRKRPADKILEAFAEKYTLFRSEILTGINILHNTKSYWSSFNKYFLNAPSENSYLLLKDPFTDIEQNNLVSCPNR